MLSKYHYDYSSNYCYEIAHDAGPEVVLGGGVGLGYYVGYEGIGCASSFSFFLGKGREGVDTQSL